MVRFIFGSLLKYYNVQYHNQTNHDLQQHRLTKTSDTSSSWELKSITIPPENIDNISHTRLFSEKLKPETEQLLRTYYNLREYFDDHKLT